ncbi:NAD(P)/FAD-dependent oxidoreductase [Methanosphaerula subterraneus]|uniref:NAD(P)/FAD-dependent oxidoreductase n=1 Tax=Methanosphaerula subterraneus TaxID=3350244 RepID=UPI003F856834
MKVAVAGAGIAGGYLARLLGQKGITADLYDGMNHDTGCGCRSCGWGAPVGIETHLARVGLALNEYLLEPMPSINFDGLVATTPLCTLDKPRLLRDLTDGLPLKRQNLGPGEAEEYDIVVDATGIARAFLPPCRSDLTLPTLQHRVAVESYEEPLQAGIYGNQIPGLGYLWVFPLGNTQYHIGTGGIGPVRHSILMDRFYRELSGQHSFTTLCRCTAVVRVASPYYSTPFFIRKTREEGAPQVIVGVGESIGTVAPFTGEGIIFSLECARMLVDSWEDPTGYTRAVLARFGWMKKERETLDYLLSKQETSGPRLRDRWRFFRNARRSGIGLPMIEAFKRIGTLSRWMDSPDQG